MDNFLYILLDSIAVEQMTFNLKEMSKVLFFLLLLLYYFLLGVLYYLYMLYVEPENKEKWHIYFFYAGFRFRIGFAGALALLTMQWTMQW